MWNVQHFIPVRSNQLAFGNAYTLEAHFHGCKLFSRWYFVVTQSFGTYVNLFCNSACWRQAATICRPMRACINLTQPFLFWDYHQHFSEAHGYPTHRSNGKEMRVVAGLLELSERLMVFGTPIWGAQAIPTYIISNFPSPCPSEGFSRQVPSCTTLAEHHRRATIASHEKLAILWVL